MDAMKKPSAVTGLVQETGLGTLNVIFEMGTYATCHWPYPIVLFLLGIFFSEMSFESPCGKLLHNYGLNHHVKKSHPLFQWSFSRAILTNYQGVTMIISSVLYSP